MHDNNLIYESHLVGQVKTVSYLTGLFHRKPPGDSLPVLTSILPKNHAGPVEKVISDFFRMPKKVGAIDFL